MMMMMMMMMSWFTWETHPLSLPGAHGVLLRCVSVFTAAEHVSESFVALDTHF